MQDKQQANSKTTYSHPAVTHVHTKRPKVQYEEGSKGYEFEKMTIAELKRELSARNLKKSGTTEEMIARLTGEQPRRQQPPQRKEVCIELKFRTSKHAISGSRWPWLS
jgi:hypothetical protein